LKLKRIDELAEDFSQLPDWEDRYRYLIELGRDLPVMDQALKTSATKVQGCASQVWIYSQLKPDGRLDLLGDSDALIVKGLIAIAFALFQPLTADEIVSVDPQVAFAGLDLKDHLTPQRSNGFASMIARIKSDARKATVRQ
jgi:cysteine desulfuration protein SufE